MVMFKDYLIWQHEGERTDVCIEDETVKYINREDVRKALHARLVGVHKLTVCSE